MSEYKRLTKRNEDGTTWVKCSACDNQDECDITKESCCRVLQDRLAELEDKIEHGTLIELPCKVGDTVYQTDGVRVYQGEIIEISLTPKHFIFTADIVCFDERAIGTRVFLTREEAEKRLKELQE